MTVKEAAVELRCSARWIRKLIADGRLPAERIGKGFMVRAAAVEACKPKVV
jgi:excisionase family DNA binding protein